MNASPKGRCEDVFKKRQMAINKKLKKENKLILTLKLRLGNLKNLHLTSGEQQKKPGDPRFSGRYFTSEQWVVTRKWPDWIAFHEASVRVKIFKACPSCDGRAGLNPRDDIQDKFIFILNLCQWIWVIAQYCITTILRWFRRKNYFDVNLARDTTI